MGVRGPVPQQEPREVEPLPAELVPPPPEGLSAAVRFQWDVFWRGRVAGALEPAQYPAVYRLFAYYDEWAELTEDWRSALRNGSHVITGQRGGERLGPEASRLNSLEHEILALEDRLGLNPMAAARLGLTVAVGTLTWQQIARGSVSSGNETGVLDVNEVLELPE